MRSTTSPESCNCGRAAATGIRKSAAAELTKLDGVSLNQFIAAAVAEKVGTLRTACPKAEDRSPELEEKH
jgi:hypothetical protein